MDFVTRVVSYIKENPLIAAGTAGVALVFVLLSKKNGPTVSNTEPQSVTYQLLGSSGGGGPNPEPTPTPVPEPTPTPVPAVCGPGMHWDSAKQMCVPVFVPNRRIGPPLPTHDPDPRYLGPPRRLPPPVDDVEHEVFGTMRMSP